MEGSRVFTDARNDARLQASPSFEPARVQTSATKTLQCSYRTPAKQSRQRYGCRLKVAAVATGVCVARARERSELIGVQRSHGQARPIPNRRGRGWQLFADLQLRKQIDARDAV